MQLIEQLFDLARIWIRRRPLWTVCPIPRNVGGGGVYVREAFSRAAAITGTVSILGDTLADFTGPHGEKLHLLAQQKLNVIPQITWRQNEPPPELAGALVDQFGPRILNLAVECQGRILDPDFRAGLDETRMFVRSRSHRTRCCVSFNYEAASRDGVVYQLARAWGDRVGVTIYPQANLQWSDEPSRPEARRRLRDHLAPLRRLCQEKRVLVTEAGWSVADGDDPAGELYQQILIEELDALGAEWVNWFYLSDVPQVDNPFFYRMGLIRSDGTPRPALGTFLHAARRRAA